MSRSLMLIPIATLICASVTFAVEDMTVLHVTDQHVPHAEEQTRATIAELPLDGPIELQPWGITAPEAELILCTGDLNEFGGGKGWLQSYMSLWDGIDIPVYHQLGNHDNTWRCGRPALRDLHDSAFYAFEHGGIRFIGWDTATPQDPRPSIAEEGLRWLASELERTPPDQPIIFFCHHALDGREFAGSYDRARLLDMLRTRNVVVMLVGHGHSARAWQVEGFDTVMGGSTFGKRPGFSIVSIVDNVLRVCHQYTGEEGEMVALLEKALPTASPFLPMEVQPGDRRAFAPGDSLRWTVRSSDDAVEGRWTLDGDLSGALERAGERWVAALDDAELDPGAHVLRLELIDAEQRVTSRTVGFFVNGGAFDVRWRSELAGSSQSTPTVMDGRVFIGDNGGALSILRASDGARLGGFLTQGEVRSRPVASPDGEAVIFASADGNIYAVDHEGTELWRHDAGTAIYGSPFIAGERVFVGTADGEMLALQAADGALVWRSEAAEYAIERAPCVGDDMVFFGSWDRHAYALDAQNGDVRWRLPSAGSDREGFVAWYYSPADCPPAFAVGNVFFADRAYRLTVFDGATGERVLDEEKCVAVAPSRDSRSVYVRHTDGRVSKRAADGSVLWMAQAPTGAVATPPVESEGIVWVISNTGVLSALDAGDGRVLASQRVTPHLFAYGAPAFDGERVYIADMAGRVTCLTPTWPRR